MSKLITSILLGLTAFGHAIAQEAHRTNLVAKDLHSWDGLSASEVTCEVAYYRRNDGQLVPTAEAQRSTNLGVNGIVLSVVEPAQFKGKILNFQFDYLAVKSDEWYLPDFLYRGQVHTKYIGTTNILPDPGCFIPVTRPLPSSDPESLKNLLRHRIWGEQFAAAIKEQVGDKALFDILYGFLTGTNKSLAQFADQKTAAKLLVHIRPACNVSLKKAIEETLSTWNISVSDWPLYLWRSFGRDEVSRALDQVKMSTLSVTERETMDAWRYWLSGDEKDLVGRVEK